MTVKSPAKPEQVEGRLPFPGRKEAWIAFLLLAVTVWTYWPVRTCQFVDIDDDLYVTRNPDVLHGLTAGGLRWAFTTGHTGNWIPLTWISHMIDCQVYGLSPAGHHFTNLLLHVANCLLLFGILRLTTGAVWRSALVAGLFALHPMHVESVAWVAERKDVLSTFFGLLSLGAYALYARAAGEGRSSRRRFYGASLVFFALSLMSKGMLVTLPFLLLLLDFWPLGRVARLPSGQASPPVRIRSVRPLILEKIPFLVLSLVSSVVTFAAQQRDGAVSSLGAVPLTHRLANVPIAYCTYIEKLLWPRNLCVLYPFLHPRSPETAALALLLLLVACAAALLWGRERPYLPVGWFWFLGTLVPVIGFVQVGTQTMADRYAYVPYVGLFIILAWGAAEVANRVPHGRGVVVASAAAALVGCIVCTRHQLQYWNDSIALCEHALAIGGDNMVILAGEGQALMEAGRYEEGVERVQRALALDPESAVVQTELAYGLEHLNRLDEAAKHYRAALALKPSDAEALNNLAWILATSDDVGPAKAAEAVGLALRACELTEQKNARFLCTLGAAYAAAGRYDEAVATLRRSHEVALAAGDSAAVSDYEKLLPIFSGRQAYRARTSPADVAVDAALQSERQGNSREAIARYREALQDDPDHAQALNNLAWILATDADPRNRDGAEAVHLATRACELTHYQQPFLVGTLAASQAEAGEFEQAASNAATAGRLFLAASNNAMAATNSYFHGLYLSHRAFHQPPRAGAPESPSRPAGP